MASSGPWTVTNIHTPAGDEARRKRGAGRWRTVVAKRASGAERAGNIDHTAITVNHSKAGRTRQVVDSGPVLTNFAIIPYWRNCTFT